MNKTITILGLLVIATAFIMSCTPEEITPKPDENIDLSDWVDLALPSGILWAKCNVGATSPQEFGDYFAWAETATKSDYDWPTYQYIQDMKLTKYCGVSGWGYNGYSDNLTKLEPMDDAATVNMGSQVHTPTKAEWEELLSNTTQTYTTIDTTHGILFTGSNGNTMFLPCAGQHYRFFSLFDGNEAGFYWSSSLREDFSFESWFVLFNSDTLRVATVNRPIGYSVRAVRYSH